MAEKMVLKVAAGKEVRAWLGWKKGCPWVCSVQTLLKQEMGPQGTRSGSTDFISRS